MKYDNVVCWIRDFEKENVLNYFKNENPYFATDFEDFKNHITETAYLIISYPYLEEWKRLYDLKSLLGKNRINWMIAQADDVILWTFPVEGLVIFDDEETGNEGTVNPGNWGPACLYEHYIGNITPNCSEYFREKEKNRKEEENSSKRHLTDEEIEQQLKEYLAQPRIKWWDD